MTSMNVDEYLFRSMLSFYSYMVEIIGMVGACIVYHLSDKLMKEKIEKVAGMPTDEIQEALAKAWPDKYKSSSATLTQDVEAGGSTSTQ